MSLPCRLVVRRVHYKRAAKIQPPTKPLPTAGRIVFPSITVFIFETTEETDRMDDSQQRESGGCVRSFGPLESRCSPSQRSFTLFRRLALPPALTTVLDCRGERLHLLEVGAF